MIVNYDRNTFIVQATCGYTLFMCKLKITKPYIFIWFLGFCNFILLTSLHTCPTITYYITVHIMVVKKKITRQSKLSLTVRVGSLIIKKLFYYTV
jgi:hypothetical protein